jgi:argininosuccinate lyase
MEDIDFDWLDGNYALNHRISDESLSFDRAFFGQDIAGSVAFARANVATGILTQNEFVTFEKGLRQVLEEWKTDKFVIIPGADEYPYRK